MIKQSEQSSITSNTPYVGRFAPSPTGELHLGSLVTALASYLDARSQHGKWLLRIEDLDPPREVPGATDSFFRTLEHFGLLWDDTPVRQSEHIERYHQAAFELLQQQSAYLCQCSRKQIRLRTGAQHYDGFCAQQQTSNPLLNALIDQCQSGDLDALTGKAAIRCASPPNLPPLSDRIQGKYHQDSASGDFIILRKDGLTAYQLAVVVDDAFQQVTHVVRGCDLLPETVIQRSLQTSLGLTAPQYAHVPAICYANGQKLSKQTFAQPLSITQDPRATLIEALTLLNQRPDATLRDANLETLLDWAIQNWNINRVPATPNICLSGLPLPQAGG